MYFIDTHTHIYLSEFDDDRAQMMERASAAGVNAFFLPAIDSSTHEAMLRTGDSDNCYCMMGLHPCSVNQDFEKELRVTEDYFEKRKFIAVGEIGLDFYWDKTFVKEQYKAFHRQIKFALKKELPIVIHSRNATDECIEVVEQYPGLKGVFHCFSGNYEQAAKVIRAGMLVGIGGVLTFKNAGLDKVMERMGLEAVILETDAPYLAPQPYRGKRNEPAYIPLIAQKLAEINQCSIDEVAKITTQNARNLFGL
jgi:TatD DNase family protein